MGSVLQFHLYLPPVLEVTSGHGFLNPKTYISHAQEKEVFKNKRNLSVSFPAIKKV